MLTDARLGSTTPISSSPLKVGFVSKADQQPRLQDGRPAHKVATPFVGPSIE